MRILIVSDTHRKNDIYVALCERYKPDMVLHAGDIEGSEYIISEAARCPVQMVAGNNDFFSDNPRDLEFTIGKYKIWLTHGHRYMGHTRISELPWWAEQLDVDIVVYGHTHIPMNKYFGKKLLINPGSPARPRGDSKPSFAVLTLNAGQKPIVEFTELPQPEKKYCGIF